ncbi:MAG: DNRLRE domain-containing protein [candidate division WOR-3 bacterium]
MRKIFIISFVLISVIFGDNIIISPSRCVLIKPQTPDSINNNRILVLFDLPLNLANKRIDYAEFSFPTFTRTDSMITIEAYSITKEWDVSTVSWNFPWQKPGGDYDSLEAARYFLRLQDTKRVKLDVTEIVKQWFSTNNYGLILKRPKREGGSFKTEIRALRSVLSDIILKVYVPSLK